MLESSFEYLGIMINKILLKIGSRYSKFRISDIKYYSFLLNEKNKKIFNALKYEYDTKKSNLDINYIKQTYKNIFSKNIFKVHDDLINYDIVNRARFNVASALTKLNETDYLLLDVNAIVLRTKLNELQTLLEQFMDMKVLESNILLLFNSNN